MKIIWCMVPEIWTVTEWIFSHFRPFFCPFIHLTTQKITILIKLKKKKKTRDILILYMRTVNENHMMYVFWDMKHDRPFCCFGPFFALLPPLTTQKKSKFWENEIKT